MRRYIIVLLLGLLLACCAACAAPAPPSPAEPPPAIPGETERLPMLAEMDATTATVYYATLDKKYLLPLNLTVNATKEVAKLAMEKLLAGPPVSQAAPIVPRDTKLLDLYSSKSTVYVNLTRDIFALEWDQAPLAVEAILNTILPLADGYTLQILIEGQICESLGNVDISAPLSLSYINPDAASRELLRGLQAEGRDFSGPALTYYLGDELAMYLVPQTLLYQAAGQDEEDETPPQVEQDPHDEMENWPSQYALAVLEAMLAPAAAGDTLTRPFWPGTRVLDLWVEDNIIFVDFSQELTGYGGGTATESLMLSCLTRSLTALPGISAVQVLIEGRAGALPEGFDISRPLTPSTPINAI